MEILEYLVNWSENELNQMIDIWNVKYQDNSTEGKMRQLRGSTIEQFIVKLINEISHKMNLEIFAYIGTKRPIIVSVYDNTQDKPLLKPCQVDVHIFHKKIPIQIIECKSYLDSCYHMRALSDFRIIKKSFPNLKAYIFSLENAISNDTLIFNEIALDGQCDGIFFMMAGKRTSTKQIYVSKYKKKIDRELLATFLSTIMNDYHQFIQTNHIKYDNL